MRARAGLIFAIALLSAISGCDTGVADLEGDFPGPWVGDWVQVNFLAIDDNGVWDQDDPRGIGFVASVTPSEWTLTDDFGDGCAIRMSYSVDSSNRFRRTLVGTSGTCPTFPPNLPDETGTFEFSQNDSVMIEWFDLLPGDEISAFKFVRR